MEMITENYKMMLKAVSILAKDKNIMKDKEIIDLINKLKDEYDSQMDFLEVDQYRIMREK
jgi:hypothetical protein